MVDTTVRLLGTNLRSIFDANGDADGDAEDELGINSTSFGTRLGSEHKAV